VTTSQWLLIVGGCLLAYLIDSRLHPYRRCGRCRGTGKRWSWVANAYGDCRRCKGDGQAIRWGARAYQAITRAFR
jgi:hypothetical protein